MTDQEINATVLKIIGWFPKARCFAGYLCEHQFGEEQCNSLQKCPAKEEESPPDFFAAGANPMPLVEEICVKQKHSLRIEWNDKTKEFTVCIVHFWWGQHSILTATLARAIGEMDAK